MINTTISEDMNVAKIDGTTRKGGLVLSDGQDVYWDTDEDTGERYYFILKDGEQDGLIIYEPQRQIKPEHVIACIAIEQSCIKMEEGEHGYQ